MNQFVVFYAWQCDRPTRFNKLLLRAALNFAAKRITDDPATNVRLKIDADIERVLGHVPVIETILNKIAACDAFVPDLTFVSETSDGKLAPNPNVMLEYGYALHARSFSKLIPVMNAAYGPPDKLFFDMRHARCPLSFDLPETATNAERRKIRRILSEDFESILRSMITAADLEANEKLRKDEATRQYLAPELHHTIERVLYI